MSVRHLLAFLFVFSADVRVKAAELAALPNSADVLQEPTDCVMRTSPCAVKTRAGEKFKLAVGEFTVVLDAQTSVVRLSESGIALLAGTVWVQGEKPFTVRGEFGAVVSHGGEFWVSRDMERMRVAAIGEPVALEPRGSKIALRVDPGEENWMGRVGGDGAAATGVPQAIPLAEHMRRWARLFPGTKRQFEKASREFHRSWGRGLASVAAYHESLAEDRRRALQEEAEKRARLKDRREKRSEELRALYRRKVLLD